MPIASRRIAIKRLDRATARHAARRAGPPSPLPRTESRMADAASHASYLPPILTFCAGAVIAVPLFRKLGQSAVLGYLAAGIVIGPSILGVIKDPDAIRGTAEIGGAAAVPFDGMSTV